MSIILAKHQDAELISWGSDLTLRFRTSSSDSIPCYFLQFMKENSLHWRDQKGVRGRGGKSLHSYMTKDLSRDTPGVRKNVIVLSGEICNISDFGGAHLKMKNLRILVLNE